MSDFYLKMISSNGVFYEGLCNSLIIPAPDGERAVLTDTIERPEDIDENRAREALERANERLRQKQSIREYHMTRAAMARALARIRESEKFAGY